jgi:hypothetical protein
MVLSRSGGVARQETLSVSIQAFGHHHPFEVPQHAYTGHTVVEGNPHNRFHNKIFWIGFPPVPTATRMPVGRRSAANAPWRKHAENAAAAAQLL